MTLAVDQTPGDGVMIYYLAYPTGTTGTVVWTGNVAGSSMQICTYSVYNAISSTPVVALGGSTSVTVNAVTDDIIIACAHRRGVSSAGWAGVTQDASYNPGSFDSAASIKRTSSLTNVTNSMSETAVVVFR